MKTMRFECNCCNVCSITFLSSIIFIFDGSKARVEPPRLLLKLVCTKYQTDLEKTHPSAAFDLTLLISWRPLRSGQRSAVPLITCQDPENHSSLDRNVGSEVRDDADITGGAVQDKILSDIAINCDNSFQVSPRTCISKLLSWVMVKNRAVIGNLNLRLSEICIRKIQ